MRNISIVIIEDSEDYNDIIKDFFVMYTEQNIYDCAFNIVGRAYNGMEGIDVIRKTQPDVVLLDLILPNIDGIKILQEANQPDYEKKPVFVVLSAINSEQYQSLAIKENIGAYFIKPTDFSLIAERILHLLYNAPAIVRQKNRVYVKEAYSSEAAIEKIIRKTGITPNLKGYSYLSESVLLSLQHPEYLDGCLTKILYPEVGKKFHTTGERVERSMRHAITRAWEGEAYPYFYTLSESSEKMSGQKPTTGFFIATIVNYMLGHHAHD